MEAKTYSTVGIKKLLAFKFERQFLLFDNCSAVAKYHNQKFTGKSIWNNVMLYCKVHGIVDPATKLMTKLLDK